MSERIADPNWYKGHVRPLLDRLDPQGSTCLDPISRIEKIGRERDGARRRLAAIRELHGDGELCDICHTAMGCPTWRAAGGEGDG